MFEGLKKNHYGAIHVDCPWNFKVWSEKGKDRSVVYATMNLDDIRAMPVLDLAADDCALFLWATDPLLPEALDVIRHWGFKYKTVAFYWAKENMKSEGWFTGLGYWTRANPEQCLLATRGKPQRLAKDVRRLMVSPRREHSRKPDETYTRIERLVGGPYLDLFARQSRAGWDTWGNEREKYDEISG